MTKAMKKPMEQTAAKVEGTFIWYDLLTTDPKAAAEFYSKVIGWKAEPSEVNPDYTLLFNGDDRVAGLMELPDDAKAVGAKPFWGGDIAVSDVDATVERIKKAGGSVCKAAWDIPQVGRIAVMKDPHGAGFSIMTVKKDCPSVQVASVPAVPGYIGWNELHAGNGEEAFAFYSNLFGWTKARAVDMGDMGVYQTFMTNDIQGGGMMTRCAEIPQPFWVFYFNVDGIDNAVKRAEKHGGKLLMGPHEVPGGQWIAQCLDPQGAFFAMLSDKR